MTDKQLLDRITLDPKVMGGKPTIKRTRLTVDYVLNLLGHGASWDEILAGYDGLTPEDIQACLLFASRLLAGENHSAIAKFCDVPVLDLGDSFTGVDLNDTKALLDLTDDRATG